MLVFYWTNDRRNGFLVLPIYEIQIIKFQDLKKDFKSLRKSIPVDEEIYIAPDS